MVIVIFNLVIAASIIVCRNEGIFHYEVSFRGVKIIRAEPHLLWKPAKTNETLNIVRLESEQMLKVPICNFY